MEQGNINNGSVARFNSEYWTNFQAQILNFQTSPLHFPNQPFFPATNSSFYPSIFPGDHLPPYFQRPMAQFRPHVTSIHPMIHGGYLPLPFLGEQQLPMNNIGVGFWRPLQHHPAQNFQGFYGPHMSGFMPNFGHMNIMQQGSLHTMGFGGEDMPYEALLALQEQVGHLSTGLREEEISRNLRPLRYQTSQEELCSICLEKFCVGDAIGRINCVHLFHYHCIAEWLKFKNCCPYCRGQALSI